MSSLQDHGFFLLISYGVSALLVVGEIALLWHRRRARLRRDPPHAAKERP